MAIICRCLPLSLRASGEVAVFCAALSTSKIFPSLPKALPGGIFVLGSLLKLSKTLRPRPLRKREDSPWGWRCSESPPKLFSGPYPSMSILSSTTILRVKSEDPVGLVLVWWNCPTMQDQFQYKSLSELAFDLSTFFFGVTQCEQKVNDENFRRWQGCSGTMQAWVWPQSRR
jgi:hypothetical protein